MADSPKEAKKNGKVDKIQGAKKNVSTFLNTVYII